MAPEFSPPDGSSEERVHVDPDQARDTWYSRGYLPHRDRSCLSQAITFRLVDALPQEVIREIKQDTIGHDGKVRQTERQRRIERFLDEGHGKSWLHRPENAETVQDSLLYHDEERYLLHAWVVMPNHVHVLFTPINESSLSRIVHSWKSYTANAINDQLDRSGSVWQREYYDRYIRNVDHFWATVRYIERNPVKANLCAHPGEWVWSSAFYRKERGIERMDYEME